MRKAGKGGMSTCAHTNSTQGGIAGLARLYNCRAAGLHTSASAAVQQIGGPPGGTLPGATAEALCIMHAAHPRAAQGCPHHHGKCERD